MKIISRQGAAAAGLSRFFTGKACKYGHVSERMIPSGNCLGCHNARGRNMTEEQREKHSRACADSYAKNRDKTRAAHKRWYEANRESRLEQCAQYLADNSAWTLPRNREMGRQRRTGFTPKLFERRLADQGQRCAICQEPIETEGRYTHADHCHETGTCRGVLCRGCNIGLGFFRDDPVRLQSAINYINHWKEKAA
jgi:hypothetical protein